MNSQPGGNKNRKRMPAFQVAFGAAVQVSGLVLTIRESITHGVERPSLYVLWATMMGVPLVWGKGEDLWPHRKSKDR